MFENFLWTPKHMSDISLHYTYLDPAYLAAWQKLNPGKAQPPRKLSEDLIQRLVDSRYVGIADHIGGSLHRSYFDMWVHTQKKAEDVGNVEKLNKQWEDLYSNALQVDGLKELSSSGYCRSRLFAGGYDAGYYVYVFSQIWAYDLFATGFAGNTMDQKRGKRYRELVLKPGGTKKPMEILKSFLGREPNTDAFCDAVGVKFGA
jgi:metallopeptidase MepB